MAKILLVDDDVHLADSIEEALTAQGYIVDTANCVKDAESLISVSQYDLLVLDWMMPNKTGIEFLQELRAKGFMSPVLMLTGRGTIDDKAAGFESGTDDYLVKPFHTREMVARVKALLRRPVRVEGEEIQINDYTLNTKSRTLLRKSEEIPLTKQEYALLEFLMRNKDEVFSSEALVERAWSSFSEASPDTVRVHITRLRKKLTDSNADCPIKTLHRQGYAFSSKAE